ncbi:MAG: 16S rRNA (guanine(527)-N(7))-methyltransferase RsmG [Rhodothermales bacterium]
MKWPFDVRLSSEQTQALRAYEGELRAVNQRFNLVSRHDEANLLAHHIGHCLAYGIRSFPSGTTLVDWGTGGGLPAIVLGILFPDVSIVAVDSNQKKTRSVDLFVRRLGLDNVSTWHGRAEAYPGRAPFSVSRATAPLATLWHWHQSMACTPENIVNERHWGDGLVCLKGGDLQAEIAELHALYPGLMLDRIPLKGHTSDPYFGTKEIIQVSTAP